MGMRWLKAYSGSRGFLRHRALANLVNIIQPTQIVFSGNAFALSPTPEAG